jgi:transposase
VPVLSRVYHCGAGEVSQVVGAMEALRKLAGPRTYLLIGDSKLLSYTNIAAMDDAQVGFVAPASKSFVPAEVLAGCDYDAAVPVDYVAERDAGRPAEQRAQYRIVEDTMTVRGRRRRDRAITLRRVFVHSSARAAAAVTARAKKLDRPRDDLDRLTRGLGSRHYPTTDKVAARVATIAAARRVGDYLHTTIGTNHNGRPTLTWHYDQQALDAEAATDGWYALLSNLDPAQASPAEILIRYKNQPTVERRNHDFKGPLAVAPIFLHTNRRITALIGVICLALLIYSLVEREVRRNLAPATKIDHLYAGRPAKPTANLIFTALASLRLRTTTDGPPEVAQPSPLQKRLFDLLKIDPTRAP